MQVCADWPVEGACLIGYCAWVGDGLQTVEEVEEYFGLVCFQIDQELKEPAGCRFLLNFFDDTPRREMIALLPEVERELAMREA